MPHSRRQTSSAGWGAPNSVRSLDDERADYPWGCTGHSFSEVDLGVGRRVVRDQNRLDEGVEGTAVEDATPACAGLATQAARLRVMTPLATTAQT